MTYVVIGAFFVYGGMWYSSIAETRFVKSLDRVTGAGVRIHPLRQRHEALMAFIAIGAFYVCGECGTHRWQKHGLLNC